MATIPPAIIENIQNKETVLFVGAGLSASAGFTSSESIVKYLDRKLPRPSPAAASRAEYELARVAELFEITYGRARLVSEVEELLKSSPNEIPSSVHQLLASLVKHKFIKTIITTNYDTLIEDACAFAGLPISVVAHGSQIHSTASDRPVLYKLHGDFFHPELLVLTPRDLHGWNTRPEVSLIVSQLRAIVERNALLFLGYSLSDFTILSLLLGSNVLTRDAPRHKRFAALYRCEDLGSATARLQEYGVDGFEINEIEELLRTIVLKLPVKLQVQHLVFNYPRWYPQTQGRYGGIETFVEFLRRDSEHVTHTETTVYNPELLKETPFFRTYATYPSGYPGYPASFFYFTATARAALDNAIHQRNAHRGNVPDVVHVHFLDFVPICQDTGIPTVCTSHSLLSKDLAFTKGAFDGCASAGAIEEVAAAYAAERAAASTARFVTVISSSHEGEVRALGAKSVRRLEAPFDCRAFQPEEDPVPARRLAHLPERFTITYVGRPDRRKGVEILIEACAKLATDGKDFQLLLVGGGFEYRGFQPLYSGRGGRDYLGFAGGRFTFDTSILDRKNIEIHVRDTYGGGVGIYYAASDIIAVPSIYEPMGYVVLEAMACGRPVVGTNIGGISETINDGKNGLLFNLADADDLARKLTLLYEDPEARKQLGRQARNDIEARRPARDIVREWERLYRQAAFAFGDSLYPSNELLGVIRDLWQQEIERYMDRFRYTDYSFSLWEAAHVSCALARRVMEEEVEHRQLPTGVPVDAALLRAIAHEFQRALRRNGLKVTFAASSLSEVMTELALAMLNRDDQPRTLLNANLTHEQLQRPWFEQLTVPRSS